MATLNVEFLRRNGPATREELPGDVWTGNRQDGLAKFTVNGFGPAKANAPAKSVYYLPDHDKRDVVRRFIEVNQDILEGTNMRAFHRAVGHHGRAWTDAARSVSEDYFDSPTAPEDVDLRTDGECPLCGEEVSFQLARHLDNDCEY